MSLLPYHAKEMFAAFTVLFFFVWVLLCIFMFCWFALLMWDSINMGSFYLSTDFLRGVFVWGFSGIILLICYFLTGDNI